MAELTKIDKWNIWININEQMQSQRNAIGKGFTLPEESVCEYKKMDYHRNNADHMITTQFGQVSSVFTSLYSTNICIRNPAVQINFEIDWRNPRESFPREKLMAMQKECDCPETVQFYWEEGGGGMDSGSPHYHKMCVHCFRKKSLISNMVKAFRNRFDKWE